MVTDRIPMLFFLLILFQFYCPLHSASTSPLPAMIGSSSQTNLSHILQDVFKNISASEKWNLKDIRVSKLDLGEVRFATSQSYEFTIKSGKKQVDNVKFLDPFVSWSKFRKPKSDLSSLIHGVTSRAVLDTLELEGPLELRVDPPHQLSLSLPMNISYTGLKRILVGEGNTLEVRKVPEVSFYYSSDYDLPMDGSIAFNEWASDFRPLLLSTMCMQLIYVRISGSASLSAYITRNPGLHIETIFISADAILLLPDKTYHTTRTYRRRSCPFDPLSLRLSMFEKILRSLLGPRLLQNPMSVSLEANTRASAAVKFPIELERYVGRFDGYSGNVGEAWHNWRRRRVEWVRFEIVARVEADQRLKPVSFKKSRPILYWADDLNSSKESFTVLDHVPPIPSIDLLLLNNLPL